jgi:hypothetical protein
LIFGILERIGVICGNDKQGVIKPFFFLDGVEEYSQGMVCVAYAWVYG